MSQNVKYGIFVANVTKTEHTRCEEIILGRILCEEAPQVVSACQPVPNRYPNLPCILTFSLYPNRSNEFFCSIFNHFQWFVKSISSFGTHMIVAQGARPKACWEGSLQQDAYHQKLGEAPLPVGICQLRRDQYIVFSLVVPIVSRGAASTLCTVCKQNLRSTGEREPDPLSEFKFNPRRSQKPKSSSTR